MSGRKVDPKRNDHNVTKICQFCLRFGRCKLYNKPTRILEKHDSAILLTFKIHHWKYKVSARTWFRDLMRASRVFSATAEFPVIALIICLLTRQAKHWGVSWNCMCVKNKPNLKNWYISIAGKTRVPLNRISVPTANVCIQLYARISRFFAHVTLTLTRWPWRTNLD